MAEAVPLTLVVEDSQPPEYYPDNQEGLEDSQRPGEAPSTESLEAVEVAETQQTEVPEAKEDSTEGTESKETKTEATEIQEKETKDDDERAKFPETLAYQDGSQGPISEQLVRQDAFLQEAEEEEQLLEASMKCKKCGLEVALTESVIRGPTELWCRECNSLYTMLRRHQQWPPACFATLSEEAQQNFFARCKQEKQDAKKTMFSYKTVRDTLVTQICEETRKVRTVGVSGTYLPLSVYRARGYEVDQGFTTRNPSEWSPGLNQWTYLLVESSVSEQEIRATTEKQVVEAERAVRKRKAPEMVADEEEEKNSTATGAATVVLDLVSESDEGHLSSRPKQVVVQLQPCINLLQLLCTLRLTEPQHI